MFKKLKNIFHKKEKIRQGYYDTDIWSLAIEQIKDKIPKGFTIYGEIFGQTPTGEWIQKDYLYGQEEKTFGIIVFRVTFTNSDGLVYNLSPLQIREFCEKYGFRYEEVFFKYGKVIDIFARLNDKHQLVMDSDTNWREYFIKLLELEYTEKDCFMNKHKKLPEEGVCIYKDSLFNTEVYKIKSFAFLAKEDQLLEQGITNIEDNA